MSSVETRKFEPATGTAVNLGASGDAVTLPAGVTLQTNTIKDAGGNTIFTSDGAGTLSSINSGLQGGMSLISSQTFSGSSGVEFKSGLGDYDEVVFYFFNVQHSNDDTKLEFQVSTNGGSSYGVAITSTFFYANHFWTWSTDVALSYEDGSDLAGSTSYQRLTSSSDNGGTISGSCSAGELHLFGCASTTYVKQFYSRLDNIFYIQGFYENFAAGYVNTTSAVDAIKFKPTANTISGTIAMYGIS